jgi:hypothetical protein
MAAGAGYQRTKTPTSRRRIRYLISVRRPRRLARSPFLLLAPILPRGTGDLLERHDFYRGDGGRVDYSDGLRGGVFGVSGQTG